VRYFDTVKEVWVDLEPVGPPSEVTYKQLLTRARRFGTICVVETAIELRLPPAQVARLRIECDELDRLARENRYRPPRRRRGSETTAAVRQVASEGLSTGEIATKLSLSEKRVLNIRASVTRDFEVPVSRGFDPTKPVAKASGHPRRVAA